MAMAMAMAILPLQLHLFCARSPLKSQFSPHVPRLKLPPHARLPAATGDRVNDVVTNGKHANYSPDDVSIQLPPVLQRELMPNHVAVIMDGNRRWAQKRGLPVGLGYEAGVRALRRTVELCCKWGISVLTVFAFSSDNWRRPKVETDFLMVLIERGLKDELQHFMSKNVRISFIGETTKLPQPLQVLMADAMETTRNNFRLHLIVAVNYSGKTDIVQACQKIALKVKDGLIEPEHINELLVETKLETNCTDYPYPDLLVRTSGELRISNFLLWQLAYTELYFANSPWPDFGEDEFAEALCSFQKRQRRYGGQ